MPDACFDYYLWLFSITDLHMCREDLGVKVFILFLQGHQGTTLF